MITNTNLKKTSLDANTVNTGEAIEGEDEAEGGENEQVVVDPRSQFEQLKQKFFEKDTYLNDED